MEISGEGTQRWTRNERKGIMRGTTRPQPVPVGMGLLTAGVGLKKGLLQISSPHSDPEWTF